MSEHTPTYKELIKEAMDQNGYHDQKSDTLWREGVLFGAQWQSEQTQSELESLRAENAELIEALRATLPILNDVVHEQIDWVRIIVRTTLAKYEKP